MAVKVTLSFTNDDGAQWTSDYWHGASVAEGLGNLPDNTIDLRLALLNKGCTLDHIRYATRNVPRDVRIQDVHKSGKKDVVSGARFGGDQAIVVSIQGNGSPPAKRRMWVRGITQVDGLEDSLGVFQPSVVFKGQFSDWILALGAAGYGILQLTPVRLVPPFVKNITSFTYDTMTGLSTITTNVAHGIGGGDEIIIYRTNVKDLPGLRGHWFVTDVPSPTTIRIDYVTPREETGFTPGGFIRKAAYDSVQPFKVSTIRYIKLGARDTKDSFTGSRGASRAKRLRHSR